MPAWFKAVMLYQYTSQTNEFYCCLAVPIEGPAELGNTKTKVVGEGGSYEVKYFFFIFINLYSYWLYNNSVWDTCDFKPFLLGAELCIK